MGARSKSMLARQRPRRGLSLVAPASLETLESHRDQRLRGVFPVSRLRPRDDERPGRQRKGFVEAEASTLVPRPDAEVRIEEDAPAFLSTRGVRPVLRVRRHQVATIFPQVEARFGLDEVFDVDHAEALAVIEELVAFVVPVRGDWILGGDLFSLHGDVLEEIAQQKKGARRRHLKLLEASLKPLDFYLRRVRRPKLDARVVNMPDGPARRLALRHEDFGVPVALDLVARERRLQQERVASMVRERLGNDQVSRLSRG